MKENVQYKNEALASLKGNWPQAVLGILLILLAAGIVIGPMYTYMFMHIDDLDAVSAMESRSVPFVWIVSIFLLMPLLVGYINAIKVMGRDSNGQVVMNMFSIAFSKNYWHNVWGYLLREIFTALWSMLLVVPGIIKSLSYAMTCYILADYPELSANKAIELSMQMMKGRKYDLFYLYLSLAGWFILCWFTLGIGFLWFYPYAQACQHAFYEDVKHDWLMQKNMQKNTADAVSASAAPVSAPVQDAPKTENPEDYMPK